MARDNSAMQTMLQARSLAPREAVEYIASKTGRKVTYHWHELWQSEHNHQFTISRLTALDLLDDVHKSLVKVVAGEMGRQNWQDEVAQKLAKKGWWNVERTLTDRETGEVVKTKFDSRRLGLIFDVNIRQAYAAGQWERFQRNKDVLPYLRYVTKDDGRVRPAHLSWHNLTLPVDHPHWTTHLPPNGFRCRCRLVAITQKEYEANTSPTGESLNKTPPDIVMRDYLNRTTGETIQISAGIDPGFGYNVGLTRRQALDKLVADKLGTADESLAKAVSESGLLLSDAATAYATKAVLNPNAVQPRMVLGTPNDLALNQVENAVGVSKRSRGLGLEASGLKHINIKHANEKEVLRNQVPITPADLAAFDFIVNSSTNIKRGDPAKDKDGTALIQGTAIVGDFEYSFVARVQKHLIVPKTLFKKRKKQTSV